MKSLMSLSVFLLSTTALAQSATPPASEPELKPATATTSTAPRSRGNAFNPEISANGLFLFANSGEGNLATSTEPNGLGIQELELQFTADVDPYSRFVALLSLHPEIDVDAAGDRHIHYVFEPEEVYAESIAVPSMTLKAGKFRASFGRHNLLHSHMFPFIDAPLYQSRLLGDEGLNDAGLSAAALVPVPWFFEITAQVLRGEAEGLDYFNSRSSNDSVALARVRNLFDLNESSTLEFGLSGATGDNRLEARTELLGVDLTYKWRPVSGGRDTSVSFTTELIGRTVNEQGGAKTEANGLSTWAQYQFARRWWAQARVEWLRAEESGAVAAPGALPGHANRWSALLGFVPTEYSAFRIQYDNSKASGATEAEHRVLAQLNFSIGAHPAHQY